MNLITCNDSIIIEVIIELFFRNNKENSSKRQVCYWYIISVMSRYGTLLFPRA